MSDYDIFLTAIKNMNIVEIIFNSNDKGVIKRKCIPLDFGSWRNALPERYHFYDLDSPTKPHPLPVRIEALQEIKILNEKFSVETLSSIITWPFSWYIKRDWGRYS